MTCVTGVIACTGRTGSFVILMLAVVIFLVSALMQRRAAQWYGRSAAEGRERLAQLYALYDEHSGDEGRP